MKRLSTPGLILLVPAFIAGTVAVVAASAVDMFELRLLLQAVAVAAIVAIAERVAALEREEALAPAPAPPVPIESMRGDRRRPTVDRATGLLASWYFRLRIEEEIARAQRYGQIFTLLCVSAGTPESRAAAVSAINGGLRSIDLAGIIGDGVAVLLPNTDRTGATSAMERLKQQVPDVEMTASEHPADGTTLATLLGEHAWIMSEGDRAEFVA